MTERDPEEDLRRTYTNLAKAHSIAEVSPDTYEFDICWSDVLMFSFAEDCVGIYVSRAAPDTYNSMWIPDDCIPALKRVIARFEERQKDK